jgi:hypothetical protein
MAQVIQTGITGSDVQKCFYVWQRIEGIVPVQQFHEAVGSNVLSFSIIVNQSFCKETKTWEKHIIHDPERMCVTSLKLQ